MTRCSNCGTEAGTEPVCPGCGQQVQQAATQQQGAGGARPPGQSQQSQRGQHQQSQRGQRQQPQRGGGTTRRKLLKFGGAGVAGVGLLWLVFGGNDGPVAITKRYYKALNRGDKAAADNLIHEDAPMDETPDFFAKAYEKANLSIENAVLADQSDDEATVEIELRTQSAALAGANSRDVTHELRTQDGNWRLWR